MSLESAVKEELQTISGLANNIFPLEAPENFAPPYVVYDSSYGVNVQTLSGVLSSKEIDFVVQVVATSYSELKTITSGVIQRLLSFQNRKIGTSDQYFVQQIWVNTQPDEIWDKEVNLFRTQIEFVIYI